MTDSIAESNARQSAFYATHDRTEEARPSWDDLSDESKREAIAEGHLIADAEDTSSSASRQHYIDTGRYMTNGETFEFADLQDTLDRMREIESTLPGAHWAPGVDGTPAMDYRLAIAPAEIRDEYRALVARRDELMKPEAEANQTRDFGDVFEDFNAAWASQQSKAYVLALVLRVAINTGLQIPDYVRREFERFEIAEVEAQRWATILHAHPTYLAHAAEIENKGD